MEHLLHSLNETQSQAVQDTQGPLMILAGPGSGKTRVLTHRVAWLIEHGVDPFRILALTFTKKAAGEMKERIIKLAGTHARDVQMGTFHAVFAKFLRIEAARIGYQSNFTIYDADDSKSVIKQILKENKFDEKTYNPPLVLHRISMAKMNLINPQEYNSNNDIQAQDNKALQPLLGHIYTLYWNRCRRSNAMDFEDILYNMNLVIRDFSDLKQKYQNKFHYILVDEYQDTCFSQNTIIKKLAQEHRNICIVGDDAQGIYSFRGARIENILNFSRDFPELKVIKLEQNYRSSKVIVNAANCIIANNQYQLSKTIWTENEEGEKINLLRNLSEREEAINIAQDIFHTKMNKQCINSDFAVIYRTNAQSRSMEEAFRKMNIPYKVFGSVSFYKRKEIKDLMAYFRLTVNQNDEEALTRIINVPARGIGKTSIDRLIVHAHENHTSLWEAVEKIMKICSKIGINQGTAHRIDDFSVLIKSFVARLESVSAYDIAEIILKESGYIDFLKTSDEPESAMRLENIGELMNAIREYTEIANKENTEQTPTLADFLMEVSLLTDLEENNENADKVSLMTAHSAKGLEFPYVYITGLEENLFPIIMSLNSRSDAEEERRLFYVAVTRAMQRLTLSYAESRLRWGRREFCEPSRFIEEIDNNLFDLPCKKQTPKWLTEQKMYFDSEFEMKPELRFTHSFRKTEISPKQQADIPGFKKIENLQTLKPTLLTEETMNLIIAGTDVEHEKFGKGKVLQVDGNGKEKKAMVFFPAVGKKNLLLKFANLKIL